MLSKVMTSTHELEKFIHYSMLFSLDCVLFLIGDRLGNFIQYV